MLDMRVVVLLHVKLMEISVLLRVSKSMSAILTHVRMEVHALMKSMLSAVHVLMDIPEIPVPLISMNVFRTPVRMMQSVLMVWTRIHVHVPITQLGLLPGRVMTVKPISMSAQVIH